MGYGRFQSPEDVERVGLLEKNGVPVLVRAVGRVKTRLSSLRLPEGVKLVPFYDQSDVIDITLKTVRRNLLEAGLLVAAILFIFLGEVRAALIVAAVIPFSLLFGFMGMAYFGIGANLMSLGALDFGMIVDGAVVMMENIIRRLHLDEHHHDRLTVIREAAQEVAVPPVDPRQDRPTGCRGSSVATMGPWRRFPKRSSVTTLGGCCDG